MRVEIFFSELNATVKTPPESTNKRIELVAKASRGWINELVDLVGRNNLLYYRDPKQGTLTLEPVSIENETAIEALLVGKK
ncbi:hypothetical protein [Acidithrix ferrooxidans]|uniref:Uncharacterized protein n=1 Tax=Acidithrix ferrooxidans TaxID=1280514 RepID=A0A0D8HG21_9ACTN|nr:hypothetical protein [Acidithrix ferrooxidans]KJF16016.1 hypothetical protein AXFE_31280 [Acidithrix ferrooxidans]